MRLRTSVPPRRSTRVMGNVVASALAKFGFVAPLKTGVLLDRGAGAASFTRATVATVTDFEGNVRNCVSGEVRFQNARRVRNYVRENVSLWTKANLGTGVLPVVTAGQTDPEGGATAYRVQLDRGAGTTAGDYSFTQDGPGTGITTGRSSIWIKSNTGLSQTLSLRISTGNAMNIVATASWQRLSPPANNIVYMDLGTQGNLATSAVVDVLVWRPMLEDVTGQSNQNPSEYVSVGALSSPYHGCMVDGVKYFDTTNPNRVASNVVYDDVPVEACEGYGVAATQGLAGSVFTTPDTAASSVTGDFALLITLAARDWSNGGQQVFAAKDDTGTNRCWWIGLTSTGEVSCFFSPDGTLAGGVSTSSGSALPFANGEEGTLLISRPAATGTVTVSYSPDGGQTFTTLGTPQASYVGGIFDGNTLVSFCARGSSSGLAPLDGYVRRARLYASTTPTGTPVIDFNPRDGWTENKLTRSGEIQNVAWDKLNTGTGVLPTVTDNYGTAPDGTQTATRVQLDIGAGTLAGDFAAVRQLTTASGENNTRTMWVKLNSGSPVVVRFFDTLMTTVTDQWQKITFSGSVGSDYRIGQLQGNIATGKAADILIWRPQLRRDFAFGSPSLDQYVATTSAARRGWYSSTTGEFWDMNGMASLRKTMRPRYLPEGATTNLVLQSSNFGTTWTAVGTPTRSAAAKYCGDIALDLIGDDSAAALEGYTQAITFTGNADKSFSFLVAQGTSISTAVRLRDTTAGANRALGVVTWAAGVPVYTATTGTQERAPEPMANGVWRIYALAAGVVAANTNSLEFYPATDAALAVGSTGTIYVGGVQAENATFASSHIPTTTATVTRNADAVSYPAAGNISATQGAIYAEAFFDKSAGVNQVVCEIGDGTANERMTLYRSAAGNMMFDVVDGGVTQASLNLGAAANGVRHKVAVRYGANDFAGSLNGAAVVADTSGTLPTVTTIYGGTQQGTTTPASSPIGPVMVAQRKLSDAEIVAISRR